MIRFLFWNVCGVAASGSERPKGSKSRPLLPSDARYRRLQRALKVMAVREQADVIVLAESPFGGGLSVNGFIEAETALPSNKTTRTRLEVYHRATVAFPKVVTVERAILHDMTVVASGKSVLLVSVHLHSKLYYGDEDRQQRVRTLAADIRNREQSIKHTRTVLVGDLNYDPYDAPVTAADGFNGVPTRIVARQLSRGVGRYSSPYFYNPMWRHLTDATPHPPGTYHRKSSDLGCRYWYLFDQVLIRPALLDVWDDTDLRIMSRAGKINLLSKEGLPLKTRFSDHLPITFALNF